MAVYEPSCLSRSAVRLWYAAVPVTGREIDLPPRVTPCAPVQSVLSGTDHTTAPGHDPCVEINASSHRHANRPQPGEAPLPAITYERTPGAAGAPLPFACEHRAGWHGGFGHASAGAFPERGVLQDVRRYRTKVIGQLTSRPAVRMRT